MIRKLSMYRTYIMGVAILWIMLFHTSGIFEVPLFLRFFQKTGYIGTDIFFFVSSYGLYYSMKKQEISFKKWYYKRFKRIYPAFLFISVLLFCSSYWTIKEWFYEISFLGFLLPRSHHEVLYWYIPSCMFFYIIFPFVYKFRKWLYYSILPISIGCIITSSLLRDFLIHNNQYIYITFGIDRIPVFLLGLLYADKEDTILLRLKNVNLLRFFILGVSFIAFLIMLTDKVDLISFVFYGKDFSLILLSLPIIFISSDIFYQRFRIINPIIEYCGKYSLELYLTHACFIRMVFSLYTNNNNTNYVMMLSILLSFPSAWLLYKLITITEGAFCKICQLLHK